MFSKTKTHRNETWQHYLSKCIGLKILRDHRHKAFLEYDVGSSIIDLYDVDEGLAYEFQTNMNQHIVKEKVEKLLLSCRVKDVHVIPICPIWDGIGSFSMDAGLPELRKRIEKWMVV